MPYEGQCITFNCEKGRLDLCRYNRQSWDVSQAVDFRLTKNFKTTKTDAVKQGERAHGGADIKLKELWFKPVTSDLLVKRTNIRDGVVSSLIGIAARKTLITGRRIKIVDLTEFPIMELIRRIK